MTSKNKWIVHLKAVRKQYPELPLREVMKKAKRSY